MIDTGGVRLAALDHGHAGAGPTAAGAAPPRPLVLLHGLADIARSMDPLAHVLRERFRVVAVDLRGHGGSDHPGAYSMLHLTADLRAVLNALGLDRPVLVGHSLGGHVALHFAGLYPDRVEALVLLEGLGPPTTVPDGRQDRRDRARAAIDLLAAPAVHRPLPDVAAAAERLRATHPRLDPERAVFLASEGTRAAPGGDGVVWRFDPRTRDWLAGLDPGFARDLRAEVRCPVLVVEGADAWETWWSVRLPPAAGPRVRASDEAWAAEVAQFPDVRHVRLEGAGHMVHFDRPAALAESVVGFLDDRVP